MLRKILTSSLLTLIALGGFFVSFERNNSTLLGNSTYADTTEGDKEGAANLQAQKAAELKAQQEAEAYDKRELARFQRLGQSAQKEEPNAVKDMYNKLVAGLNLFLGILTMVVSPAIMLAGWLMSPDWTSGDLFGLRAVMYKLWVTISNITYFIYAILLIFIALATIFGRENYGYKAMLPKLALGIILVPFTWWFVQWTISLTSVITASVISIPHDALSELNAGSSSWWTTEVIPKKIEVNNGKDWDKVFEGCGKTQLCLSPQEFLSNSSGMYGYMMVYAYGVFKIQEVKKLETVTDQIGAITQIIHSSFIAILMFLIFGILTLALVFMLLARAVMLWVYTIFSPFLTLELVMGGMMKKVSDDFSIKEFVGLAFVPALVGLALSFGLVVVAAVQTPNTGNNPQIGSSNGTCDGEKLQGEGCIIANIMGNPNNQIIRQLSKTSTTETKDGKSSTTLETKNTVKFGDVDFIFIGKATGASDQDVIDKQRGGVNSAVSVINSAGGIFGTIIVDIIALLFIWMAFMAAKGVSKVVDAAAKPFQEMGESIGKLGASLPKYTPIPGLGVSPKGMSKLAQDYSSHVQGAGDKKAYESSLAKALGIDTKGKETTTNKVRIEQAHASGKKLEDHELQSISADVKKMVSVHGLASKEGKDALNKWSDILEKSGKNFKRDEMYTGDGNITTEGVRALEDWKSTTKSSVTSASPEKVKHYREPHTENATTTSTPVVGAITKNDLNDNFKIEISGVGVTFVKNKSGGIESIENTSSLIGKKNIISESELMTKLMNAGMKKDQAKAMIENIRSNAQDFISKEAS